MKFAVSALALPALAAARLNADRPAGADGSNASFDGSAYTEARRLSEPTPEWAKGGNICALGILQPAGAPLAFYCNCGNATQCEEHGVFTTIVGLAGGENCPSSAYDPATCTSAPAQTNPALYNIVSRRFWAQKDIQIPASDGGGKYAMMTDGIGQYLDTSGSSYYYFGTAYYLVQDDLSYNSNSFLVPYGPTQMESVLSEVCIKSPNYATGARTECGATATAEAGSMKFAIFGGPWWGPGAAPGDGKGVGFGWVRTAVCYKYSTTPKVEFAGNSELVDVTDAVSSHAQQQVKSIRFGNSTDNNFMQIDYEQEYFYGHSADCTDFQRDAMGFTGGHTEYCMPRETKQMVIRVAEIPEAFWRAGCPEATGAFFVDYGIDGVGHEHYFVYDPKVTTKDSSRTSDATRGSFIAVTASAGLLAALLV